MQIFKTERPNIGYYIIKSGIITSLLLLSIFVIAFLFSFNINKETIIILLAGYGVALLDESRCDRIQEIKFDEVTKEIIFV